MTMLAQHEWPEANRKRIREDEYADVASGGTLGFTEHRSKRLQSLPLRTSPPSKRWSDAPTFPSPYPSFGAAPTPHALTPGDSDSEDTTKNFHPEPQLWPEAAAVSDQHLPAQPVMQPVMVSEMDGDMDMMDTSEPPAQDQTLLEAGPSQPDPIAPSITGRMPTPIHCTFAAQVRGNNWGGAAGNIMASSPMMMTHEEAVTEGFAPDAEGQCAFPNQLGHESIPRSLDGPAATAAVMENWSMVQNRRLPSPISESGGEEGIESPRMVLDSSSQMGTPNHHGHQHPMLDSLPPRASSAVELGQAHPPPRDGSPTGDGSMDVEGAATPSPKKGHTRSRHTLNSWTALQPGMKRSFSIGYRADCEKCRMKVPGHFNHIIIS